MKKLIKEWFSTPASGPVLPMLPEGERIYAIGDIHGSLHALQSLHELILLDSAAFVGQKSLVYLGDYIDRGEHSREVIDLLLKAPVADFKRIFLLGNHEQSLLDFLEHPQSVAAWLNYGGRATLRSYGVSVERDYAHRPIENLRDELAWQLPRDHLEFFRGMSFYHLAGSYCFVHAGIRPGIPMSEQRNEDLLWIREDFTRSQMHHDHIVVHGHSITTEVDWNENRIGIDTGAFHSGVLTCLVLEGNEQRVLQTGLH